MKKYFILVVLFLFICGCKNVNKASVDDIIYDAITSKRQTTNTVKVGYKYYKPAQMSVIKSFDYNEVLRSNDTNYYLYADVIAYFNKVENTYEENDLAYYSKKIDYKNKSGYIEINEYKANQYLIEIMYNYAKIEVMVEKRNINIAVAYIMSILSSVKYNDVYINNVLGTDALNSYEESINIFETKGSEGSTLKYVEDSHYDKDVLPDMDLVN